MATIKKLSTDLKSLSLIDRLLLLDMASQMKGTYQTLTVSDDLVSKVKISQDEIKKYEIKFTTDADGSTSIHQNKKCTETKFKYEFTELEKVEMKLIFEQLEAKKMLSRQHKALYEIFVLNK